MCASKYVKCKICGKKYVSKQALIDHIERQHSASIPEGWNAARYENFLRTGKTEGRCVYCKKETTWNDATGKYNRMCGSEACKKIARERANKNYIGLHGKPYTINDPEQQKKMIYSRKNSGKYIFEDDDGNKYEALYDSSYGKDFFEMIDTFLNWDGRDIIAPSPHTYWYEYEGKKHFYIPDAYSTSLNLEIEFKDGGDNPNNHPKIQAVDKVKEAKKDAVMESLKGQVNYIKICNKDYTEFFALLSRLKEQDKCPLPKWEKGLESVTESALISEGTKPANILSPGFVKRQANLVNPYLNYDDLIDYYRKQLFHRHLNDKEWQSLYAELLNMREYLKKAINSNDSEENQRMRYEAKKALDEVERFILYMEEENSGKKPITESVNNDKIPIYIVSWNYDSLVGGGVRLVTKSEYNHTSISLVPDLEQCYTFSRNPKTTTSHSNNGFCHEPASYLINRHKDPIIKVDAVYIPKSKYDILKKNIDEYIKRQSDTSFDYINFLYIFFKIPRKELNEDKLNCSVFVDLILKKSGIDLTKGKPSNLVTPNDLAHLEEYNKNVQTVYIGEADKYDFNNISKVVNEATYIEATKNDITYYPVFIFLSYTDTKIAKLIKAYTHDPYAHSSISFDTKLDNMLSFDARGLVNENILTDVYKTKTDVTRYSLYAYMATIDEYNSMKAFTDELLGKRKKLGYNILGLTNFIFGRGSERENKFFCSEFVASVINAGNNKVIKTKPYLTSPYMLAKNKNFVFIKTGILKHYNVKVVDSILAEKLEEGGFTNVVIK